MNESIGTILKNSRKNVGMSVEDVSDFLGKHNIKVATKTIYGWENDSSSPNINIFLLLCEMYGIKDVLQTFGHKSKLKYFSLYFSEKEYSKNELNDIMKYAEFIKSKRNK